MEYKIMTREELEYMMMDLHVICLMKDAEIERLNDENKMLRDRNECLRTQYNRAVVSQRTEKAELLGKIESLKRQLDREIERIDELSDQCSEQLETIATLQKANNNQERTIKNQEARILIKNTNLENLKISLKKAIDEKMAMIEEIKIYIDTIKKLEAVEKNNPPVMDDTDCDSSELPYRADTESRPKFDDSVDCRPRKQ